MITNRIVRWVTRTAKERERNEMWADARHVPILAQQLGLEVKNLAVATHLELDTRMREVTSWTKLAVRFSHQLCEMYARMCGD